MLRRFLVLALLAGGLLYGLSMLFLLRFRSGDVYPAYSSLRADPLGTKAFYDSLDEFSAVTLHRNYRPIIKFKPERPTTLIYAGTPHRAYWGDSELRHVEQMAINGARVVVTFLPIDRGPTDKEEQQDAKEEKEKKEERAKKAGKKRESKESKKKDDTHDKDDEDSQLIEFSKVAERWGFGFRFFGGKGDQATFHRKARLNTDLDLDPELSWHSALYFGELKDGWESIYVSDDKPVIIERPYGDGSLVLASDSYFLSNEALRRERHPRVLSWLIGNSPEILFDEESHGVRENPGMATLFRKYGLHGLAGGLLLLAALFLWKNGFRFIPAQTESNLEGDLVLGKEAEEGFVHLLRRSVPPADLLAVCVREWKRSFHQADSRAKAARIDEIVSREQSRTKRERNPIAAYHAISKVLSEKK